MGDGLTPTQTDRIEQALSAEAPGDVLLGIARQLRDEGMSQSEMYALFDSLREPCSSRDETRYDAILDIMDFIGGWCSPTFALYPSDTDAA